MTTATKETAQARRLFLVKPGRVLLFPGISRDGNQHLWAKGGDVVDATHPILAAIVAKVEQNVEPLAESALNGRAVNARLHPAIAAKMKEYDTRERTRPQREAEKATAKAQRLGTDPKALPKATREAS